MPIPLKSRLEKRKVSEDKQLIIRRFDERLATWWYCGVYKNEKESSQPHVLVAFRKLLNSSFLSDEIIYSKIPITALGQFRVGTVWQHGKSQEELFFETGKFEVNFTQGNWRLTTFQQAFKLGHPTPYPQEIHRLQYQQDQNWLLEFMLPHGGRLIVPCLEFFTRCYGRSAALRRLLSTYGWQDLLDKHLYAPLDEPEEPGIWKVKLRKRLTDGDTVLLAHAKYQAYTQHAVKQIYSQIETSHYPKKTTPTFIQVSPWFEGPAELKAKGIWFDEGRSFLALQIVGGSDPGGVDIWQGRENASNAKRPASEDTHPTAWSGTPQRQAFTHQNIIDLTDDLPPNSHVASIVFEDPPFEILGTQRIIHKIQRDQAKTAAGAKAIGTEASKYSSGEPRSNGQDVGYAAIHARPVLESQGMLRDMWNAMQLLRRKHPNIIQSVTWYTFEEGHRSDIEPNLIAIQPFDKRSKGMKRSVWTWPFMSPNTRQELRGVLVMRIIVEGELIYVLEIQRRPQIKKDKDGTLTKGEQNSKGLIFSLYNQGDLDKWLSQFLLDIRPIEGVVDKLKKSRLVRTESFSHKRANSDNTPYEAAAINALKKMGINIPT